MNSEWIVVVEPMPREKAERAIAVWLKEQADQGNSLYIAEIREDVIFSKDHRHIVRYAVRVKEK